MLSKTSGLRPTARDFVPKSSVSEFVPKAAREVVPNPAEEDASIQQHTQGAREVSDSTEAVDTCHGGVGQPYSGQPYSWQWQGWDESQEWLWGGGEDAWDGEGWEQGYGLWDKHGKENTAGQAGGWEGDGPWWDGRCLTDGGSGQGPPMSGMEGVEHRPQQGWIGGEPCGQGKGVEQAEPRIGDIGSWGAYSGGGLYQWGRGRGRGMEAGASRGVGTGRGRSRGKGTGMFLGMARTCEKLQPEQAAELLGILFPGYCKDAIAALLAANNGRVVDCVQELHLLEQETFGGARGGAPDMGLDGLVGEDRGGAAGHATPHPLRKAGCHHVEHVALDNEGAFPALNSTSSTSSKVGGGSGCSSNAVASGTESLRGEGGDPAAHNSGKDSAREEGGCPAARRGAWVEAAKHGADKAVGAQQQQQQQQQQHKRQLLLQSLRPLSSSPASAGQRACASTSAADEVRSLACTQHIPWVETGDTVSKQYADARSEARDWCRLRNHCFQQATLAYCNGNKALAKELSIKGRSAADKMWEAHASAADTILATRNAKHREKRASLYQISCGAHPHFVDLHGLHVQEALAVIAQYLEEGTSTPAGGHKGNVLRVCVGTGHHTMGPTANAPRLAAAVMNALREWGVRYRVLQPGLLEVLL